MTMKQKVMSTSVVDVLCCSLLRGARQQAPDSQQRRWRYLPQNKSHQLGSQQVLNALCE